MIINYNTKTIQIKVVFFGPAMSGKTTSLKYIMSKFNAEQNLRSIETSTGRTLVFDFGCLNISGKEWSLKILLLSATGQDFYASTRPATVEMVDGLIFVVDSQRSYLDDNKRSWNELSLYFGEKIFDIPIIVCLNKQDLIDVLRIDEIKQEFRLSEFKKYEIMNTVAKDGTGVIESFQKLLQNLFPTLTICQA
jgi:small GTP-binding protein